MSLLKFFLCCLVLSLTVEKTSLSLHQHIRMPNASHHALIHLSKATSSTKFHARGQIFCKHLWLQRYTSTQSGPHRSCQTASNTPAGSARSCLEQGTAYTLPGLVQRLSQGKPHAHQLNVKQYYTTHVSWINLRNTVTRDLIYSQDMHSTSLTVNCSSSDSVLLG